VFLKIGMDVRFEGFDAGIEDAVNEGVRRGYNDPDNKLRASIVADPHFERKNTKDNTPAVVHMSLVPGQHGRRAGRGQGRRQREQEQVRDDESERQPGRLGAQDGADDGRRLVPAGHAGHRHRRHGREGDAARQGKPDAGHRHVRAEAARARRTRSRSCASSCATRSTRWASARRAWAA
jgi:hypothetical protein